jgi:hypothetical protein
LKKTYPDGNITERILVLRGLRMPGWQLTATTIYCEDMADEVTLLVQKDWTVKCTGARRQAGLRKAGKQGKGLPATCDPASCGRVQAYRAKLQGEEGTPA